MKKKEIRLDFSDFHGGFDKRKNFFFRILSKKFDVVIDENDPEYLIYSCFGNQFLKYDCVRIFYTGENIVPDFNFCDYGISFFHLEFEDRYLRFPNFLTYGDLSKKLEAARENSREAAMGKSGFCNFIYSNGGADPVRDNFYGLLSKYRHVDSAGRHLRNTEGLSPAGGDWVKSKIDFQSRHKFSIAFENSSVNGYTTEKIVHAFLANSIPIYWGNPLIVRDFNPKAFVNCHDFGSFEEVVEEVRRLDSDDRAYQEMLLQPVFCQTQPPEYLEDDYLLTFFEGVFTQPLKDSRRRPSYGYAPTFETKLQDLVEGKGRQPGPRTMLSRLRSRIRKLIRS